MTWSYAVVSNEKGFYLTELYYERTWDDDVKILGYSEEEGPFKNLDDMLELRGVGDDLDEALNQEVYYVEGDTCYLERGIYDKKQMRIIEKARI